MEPVAQNWEKQGSLYRTFQAESEAALRKFHRGQLDKPELEQTLALADATLTQGLLTLHTGKLKAQKQEAYTKALDSLGRYKFLMFGYWAAQWVTLNKLEDKPEANPFRDFVELASNKPPEFAAWTVPRHHAGRIR